MKFLKYPDGGLTVYTVCRNLYKYFRVFKLSPFYFMKLVCFFSVWLFFFSFTIDIWSFLRKFIISHWFDGKMNLKWFNKNYLYKFDFFFLNERSKVSFWTKCGNWIFFYIFETWLDQFVWTLIFYLKKIKARKFITITQNEKNLVFSFIQNSPLLYRG